MKKFLFLMVSVAVAVSASAGVKNAQTKVAKFDRSTTKTEQVVRMAAPGTVSTPYTVAINSLRDDIPEGYCSVTLAAGDVWQDGSGYQMLFDADANTYGTVIPETGALTLGGNADAATYAEFEYKIPENADGDMATANIVMNDAVTIFIPAGIYDWCITNPTPGDRIWIASSNGNIPGRYDNFEFAAGATYIFTVSLGGQNDRVDLEIVDPAAPVMPTNLTVDPAATTADVAWENDHDMAFNLRYRPWTDMSGGPKEWHFGIDTYEAEINEGFWVYDADGDGVDWGLAYSDDTETDVCWYSGSYISGYGVLTPDNYLGTPNVPLKGQLKFTLWGRSDYYPENLMVYAMVGEEFNLDNLVPLFDADILSTVNPVEYTVDLSQFNGEMGCIVFRNYGTEDQWMLYLDDIYVGDPNDAIQPEEWIYVNDLPATNFTIEGLTPETTYEVEVQSVSEDGRTSDWTEPVVFTTLEAGDTPEPPVQDPTIVLVLVDQEGNEVPVELAKGADGDYTTTYTFEYNPWGAFVWDPALTDEQNEANRPNVPFYFLINGVRFGADEAMRETVLGYAMENPLEENAEGFYCVPVGFSYTLGVALKDGGYYVYAAVSKMTGVDEVNSQKTVAGVRYFNMVGQEMQEANGMTIVVTTYTDGTTSAVKVMK